MAKQCRSIARALRRGHPLRSGSNIFLSKKEATALRAQYEAILRKIKEEEKLQKEENDKQESDTE